MSRGLLDMLLATVAFVAMVALVRGAGALATPLELVFWRSVLGAGMMLGAMRGRPLGVRRRDLLGARVVLGTLAMGCFFTAAARLSVTEVSLISQVQPVLVAVLAPLALGTGERAGGRVGVALVAGLVGCVLLLGPEALSGSWWGLWAVAAAGFSAVAHVTLRALGATEDPRVVVWWFNLGGAGLAWGGESALRGAPLGLPDPAAWPWALGVAATATAGQLLMTRAYQREQAAAVAAVSYTGPVWAVLGDVVFFGLTPEVHTVAGGALVVGAGLWLARPRPA